MAKFMSRRHDMVDVEVTDIRGGDDYIILSWDSPHLVFGEYTIRNDFTCESEYMDQLPDLSFLVALLNSLKNKIIRVEE